MTSVPDASPLTLLWLLQCGSAIALFWLIRELLKLAMSLTNDLLVKLPYLEPFQPFYHDPTGSVLLTLGILVVFLPWLLDAVLRLFYGWQPLSIDTLTTKSPEASRVLQRYCQQRKVTLPQLGVLPTLAPIALTYGNLPRTARIVVSRGLLDQLADDEIATIYASQIGHIAHWDFVVMSVAILVSQLPYIVYQQVSLWGDRRNQFLQITAALFASCAYGIWFLLRLPVLWLSQLRIYYSDRFATHITGNPNSLGRALLKIAQGITKDIQQQGHTSWLLESWNLLIPISYHQAMFLGNLQSDSQIESVLAWEYLNPVRYWLNINNTHPLIGDRLYRLSQIAPYAAHPYICDRARLNNTLHPALRLQAAPFFGIILGFLFGIFMWLVGGIGIMLGLPQLTWMYGDWSLIQGCLPIGYSFGTLIRINAFFPDSKPAILTDSNLTHLLSEPNLLPINSQFICPQGKLLGRCGISNWLGQDLMLLTEQGLVKLHYVTWLRGVSRKALNPTELLGRIVITTG